MGERARRLWVAFGLISVAVLVFCGGWSVSAILHRQVEAQEHKIQSDRDAKILAVIVRKNPRATIADFSGFPDKLASDAEALGLDFRYVMALIDRESDWRPDAVSGAGAIGLMQVVPETAALVAKGKGWVDYVAPDPPRSSPRYRSLGSLGSPEWNVRIGLVHLKDQIDRFGLGPEHLRAYNRGEAYARVNRPRDRYAEDVAFRFVALANEIRD